VTTTDGGTGFGLAIVSSIASAHDWSIRATESESGGARFEVAGIEPAKPTPETPKF
jgi:signal transduction histidine kinase